MSFEKRDFLQLSRENRLKKVLHSIISFIENNKKEDDLKKIVNWLKETENINLLFYKKDSLKAYYDILAILKNENPFIEDYPFDNNKKKRSVFKIKLIIDNIRSPFNIGSILRNSEAFGVEEVYICGLSPTPDTNNKIKKTFKNCRINTKYYSETIKAIMDLKKEKFKIVSLEKTSNSVNIEKQNFSLPLAIVVGNEEFGISKEVLELSDRIIHIPMLGTKNSVNVSVASGIALFEIYKKIKA